MFIDAFSQKGEQVGEVELPEQIFGQDFRPDLVHQVVVGYQANQRQGTAHTKTRAEVSGGGRKPWPQKGTGRARHGSIRSPLWKGGGTTFGPRKQKKFKQRIPKKMRKQALFCALSSKVKDRELVVLDQLQIEQPQTQVMAQMIKDLKQKIEDFKEGSILVLLPKKDHNLLKSLRNLAQVKVMQAKDINALDVLKYKYLLVPKSSIKVLKKRFLKT